MLGDTYKTPKHGSRLNIAVIGLSVLEKESLILKNRELGYAK